MKRRKGAGPLSRRDKAQSLAGFTGLTIGEMVVAEIPLVGGAMSVAITALELAHVHRRLEALAEELGSHASRVQEQKADRAYVDSPQFVDAMIAGIEAARRTSDRDKLRMIASILVGSATVDRPIALDIEGVLTALRDLSPQALALMRDIDHEDRDRPRGAVLPAVVPPMVPDREFLLGRLVAAGLIQEMAPNDYVGSSQYLPTTTWSRIVEVLEAGGWEEPHQRS